MHIYSTHNGSTTLVVQVRGWKYNYIDYFDEPAYLLAPFIICKYIIHCLKFVFCFL